MPATLLKIAQQRKYQTIFLITFFIFVLCSNQLNVFIDGRFWMEEGKVFFNNALIKPPLQALFFSYAGYLNLPVNAATLLARWIVPLEYAPYVTSFVGLLFQLLPIFLILTAQDEWLFSFKARFVATLLLLFAPETSIDISLHSLNSQFHITLACAIILFLKPADNYIKWIRLGIIFIATLSGLMPIFLIPLYAIKFLIERKYLRLQQLLVLFIGCCLQYFFFYEHFKDRPYHLNIFDFLSIFFTRDLLLTLVGYNRFTESFMFRHAELVNTGKHFFVIPSVFTLLFIIIIIYCFYKYPKTRVTVFLLLYAIISLMLSIFGEVGGLHGFYLPRLHSRYVYISISLLCLIPLYFIHVLPQTGRIINWTIIIWLIFIGIWNFYTFPTYQYYTYPNNKGTILPWKKQVQLWYKMNRNYEFNIWPWQWTMTLPPRDN